jgi:VCBS repeat-containing protein
MRIATIASALLLTLALSAGVSAIEISGDTASKLQEAAKTLKVGESKKVTLKIKDEKGVEKDVEVTVYGTASGILVSSASFTANFAFKPLQDGTVAITVTTSSSTTPQVFALSTDGKIAKADSFEALAAAHGGVATSTNQTVSDNSKKDDTKKDDAKKDDAKGGGGDVTYVTVNTDIPNVVNDSQKQNDGKKQEEIHNGTVSGNRPQ